MIIIYTLIAAYVLAVLALVSSVYRENKRNLKSDENKNIQATPLEPDDLPERELDSLFKQHTLEEYRAGLN